MANVSQTAARCTHWHLLLMMATLFGIAPGMTRGADAVEFFPLQDVKPGLRGVGRTVFQGDRIEEFQVEVLGVIQNGGPGQSIILARLSGGPLAETGVIQGMSGSPVYIGGRLLGAVALGFPYSKEPIAGIQPIAQMLAGSTFDRDGVGARRESAGAAPLRHLSDFHQGDVVSSPRGTGGLTQILTPLDLSGFTQRTIQEFAPRFRALGFEPQEGVSSASASSQGMKSGSSGGTILPGSMISVQLLSGDMTIGADGTVTHVDGKRVYAFGHRFLDIGSVELPFARSEVIAVVPTLNTSFKLSRPTSWVGSILSDRATAVAGEIGTPAHTIPMLISVHSAETGTHDYHLELANDRLLTPFLAQTALFSAIDATERSVGKGTIRLHSHVEFGSGQPPLDLHDIFVSDSGLALQVSSDAVVTLAFALSAGFRNLNVSKLSFELEPTQQKQQLYISQAWTSVHEARPGEIVTLTAVLGGENGLELRREASYRIPLGAPPGLLNFTVSDANTVNFPEFAGMTAASAKTPGDLIALLNQYRGAEAAYVRVWRSEPAFSLAGPAPGAELSDPPPSTMLILADPSESPTANTAQLTTRGSGVAEFRLPVVGYVVSGAKTVQVDVKE